MPLAARTEAGWAVGGEERSGWRRALLRWGGGAGHGPGMTEVAPAAAQAPSILCAGPSAGLCPAPCGVPQSISPSQTLALLSQRLALVAQHSAGPHLAGLLEHLVPHPCAGQDSGSPTRQGRGQVPPWGEPSAESTHLPPLPSSLSSSCASGVALSVRSRPGCGCGVQTGCE